MSCAWLSTVLDQEMLEVVRRVRIAPRTVSYQILLVSWQKTGRQVAGELGGRYLLRYLLRHQVGSYINGSTDRHYTTPTPYSPADTVSWLTLPSPTRKRDFVMLLDPTKIDTILGPRWTRLGKGIEYILPGGFNKDALVWPWELQTS